MGRPAWIYLISATIGVVLLATAGLAFQAYQKHRAETFANSLVKLPVPSLESVATIKDDISYCGKNDSIRTLGLYRPKNRSDNDVLPVVAYVHGGGWRAGDSDNRLLHSFAPFFLERGFAVASIDYRLVTPNPYPNQNSDIACALSFLHKNNQRYKLNTQRLVTMGDSAGGQLAIFASLNIPYDGYAYPTPKGIIDFYGVTDFSTILDGPRPDLNARRYLGKQYHKNAAAASPITYVKANAPPILIFHGDRDGIVPVDQSIRFDEKYRAAGSRSTLVIIPGARHSFHGSELPKKDYLTIMQNLDTFLQGI